MSVSSVPGFAALPAESQALATMLCDCGQGHLFEGWSGAGADEEAKAAFFAQVAKLQASFDELLPGKVNFVLANYQEWLDKPGLYIMEQNQHAELVKLENDRNVMIRKGMINLAIGKDIAGAGSDGAE